MKNENNTKYAPVVTMICALTLFVTVCCAFLVVSNIKPEIRDNLKENVNNFLYKESENNNEEPVENATARLMCAGNNMIYRSIYANAASLGSESGKKYDFNPMYAQIKSTIAKSDVAMINQSTVLSAKIPVSSSPKFSSPIQVGSALYKTGFRVINHANTNVFDKDVQGAKSTLYYWGKKSDVIVTGLYKNTEDKNTVKYKEVNGIKIAFLGFTDSVQGKLTEKTRIRIVNLGDRDHTVDETYKTMKRLISKAKNEADVVVVSMCFDNTSDEISQSQQQTVDNLVSYGADVVVGCGMNRILPAERINREDGTSAVVYYSLGNFLTAEEKKENLLGAIADITFEKDAKTGKTIVKSAKAIPILTYYKRGYTDFKVILAKNITEDDLASHALNSYYGGLTAEYVNTTFSEVFKKIPDADFSTESTTETQKSE